MRTLAVIGCALGLAACGPAEQPPAAPVPVPEAPVAAAPAPALVAACTAADLQLAVTGQDAGAGNRYTTLALTNTGAAPCTLQGYPEIALLGVDGQPRAPFRFEPSPVSADISPVTLQPGGQAWFDLHTTAVAGEIPGETEPCPAVTTVRAVIGGANVETPLELTPCNQRARVTPVRGTAELVAPQ